MDSKEFFRKAAGVLILLFWADSALAQAEMADAFRSEGKIYVVLAVIAVVWICLLVFLFYLDKKINRIYGECKTKMQSGHE
ncbi:MAG: CcmD family protein [Bacteroidia bacterium]|nr:CcmD family protein [Bacteroidia bacterium]